MSDDATGAAAPAESASTPTPARNWAPKDVPVARDTDDAPAPPPKADAAPKTPAPEPTEPAAEPTPPPSPKWKLKRGKEEVEVEQEEAIRLAQLGYGAHRTFEEAARLRKDADMVRSRIKSDTAGVLTEHGINPDEWAVARVRELIRRENMTPEQRAQADFESERTKFERERAEFQRQREEAIVEAEAARHADEYRRQFTEALKGAKVPVNDRTVQRMAQMAAWHMDRGMPIDATHLAKTLREQLRAEVKESMGAFAPEELDLAPPPKAPTAPAPKIQPPPTPARDVAPKPRNSDGTFRTTGTSPAKKAWDEALRARG